METKLVNASDAQAEKRSRSGRLSQVVVLMLSALWLARVMTDLLSSHGRVSLWRAALPLALTILALWGLFGDGSGGVVRGMLGDTEYIQVYSLETAQRLRKRYEAEIDELKAAGFDLLFSCGEGFSLFRTIFIFPAIVIIMTLMKRDVTAIGNRAKFLLVYPVLGSKDKTTFAYPFGLGVKFYTGFEDGTVLVSKNFESPVLPRPGLVAFAGKASISDTWAKHQSRIQKLELEGKPINRQTDFEYYAKIAKRG